jgi:nucleotide-binding universal stress UspA family protein
VQLNDVPAEVHEGDPRNVLCEAIEKHQASILVVGSHGYGAVQRYDFIAPNYQLHCVNNVSI